MSIKIIDGQDPDLLLTGFISSGKELLQKCKDVDSKISGLIEDSFSQFFLEIDPKIGEFYQTIQSKKIKILDNERLDDLKWIVTALQTFQPHIQKVSKIFIDSVFTKIEDLQCVQRLLDLTTDSEKAQVYLKRAIDYFDQKKYDKAILVSSQAIVLDEELKEAYSYHQASLDAMPSHEAVHSLLKALNRNLHNPVGIESLLTVMHKQQRIFSYHQKAITGVLPFGDNRFLTGSLDGTLCLGSLEEDPLQFDWKQVKPQGVTTLLRLNKNTMVSGHSNNTLIVWDIAQRTPLHLFEKYHSQAICSLLRLSDDQFVSYDGLTLKFWDMKQEEGVLANLMGSKKCVKTIPEKGIIALEVFSNGNLVFASKSTLKFFDTKNYKIIEEIDTKYSNSHITKIKELEKGKFIIGYGDGSIQIFDSNTKKFDPVVVVSNPQRSIKALEIFKGKYWMSGSQDGQVKVWGDNNICLSRIEVNSPITSLCVNSDLVYIGCEDGSLHLRQPSLIKPIRIDDESLIKQYNIESSLVIKLKDEEGQYKD